MIFQTYSNGGSGLTHTLYCKGTRVSEPKKWLVPNFIFKGWEWCIWTITTIIHHQIWSADSTVDITVIQVQNCQHWAQLLKGCLSTFLIVLGEILSIFIWIFRFHWKIWMILMFGLHFRLLYFCILCQNSQGQNGGQTSRSSNFSMKSKNIYKNWKNFTQSN